MQPGNCYIFGAGEFEPFDFRPNADDYVIAADGGYLHLQRMGMTPHLILGDMDSLGEAPKDHRVILHKPEKEDTDMHLAALYGYDQGYRRFHIFGGMGGRLSHTLSNIQTLYELARRDARGVLHGKGCALTALHNGAIHFAPEDRGTISVFTIDGTARSVSIDGLKYPLDRYTLLPNRPIGVSNELIGQFGRIAVEQGGLAVIWEGGDEDDIPMAFREGLYL